MVRSTYNKRASSCRTSIYVRQVLSNSVTSYEALVYARRSIYSFSARRGCWTIHHASSEGQSLVSIRAISYVHIDTSLARREVEPGPVNNKQFLTHPAEQGPRHPYLPLPVTLGLPVKSRSNTGEHFSLLLVGESYTTIRLGSRHLPLPPCPSLFTVPAPLSPGFECTTPLAGCVSRMRSNSRMLSGE